MEQTLIVLKPDTVQRGLVGQAIQRFEDKGLQIAAIKMIQLNMTRARRMYSVHKGKDFYEKLLSFITSGPVVAMVLRGQSAIQVARGLMGSTDAAQAQPGTIRGDWGLSRRLNLIHGSDSEASARREIPIFFRSEEICKYSSDQDRWVYGQ
ncbi:MAG: nucleoside-diphosphate kinase [Phycisphaerae bacterium]